jgi:hypothetical protein
MNRPSSYPPSFRAGATARALLQVPPPNQREFGGMDQVADQDPMDPSQRLADRRRTSLAGFLAAWVLAPIAAWALIYFLTCFLRN